MMNIKSLVYSRSSPLKLFPHTQQQTLSKNCIKSQVYSRMPTESSLLEGTSFEAQFRSVSRGMNDMPKELRAINMDEGQEQQNDSTGGLGNMPELTLLLEDDDVVKKFSDPPTANLLREISMDPSLIEKYRTTPEIKYMLDKIEGCRARLRAKGLMPTEPNPAPTQLNMTNQ